jgi:hydroxypyruvate reductase
VADAQSILRRYNIAAPEHGWSETGKQVTGEYRMVASGTDAVAAAAHEATKLGYSPVTLECAGEARHIAREHARLVLGAPPGTALISGGELTVAVRGSGYGGPNHEYALAAALALRGTDIRGLAGDTDGIDGNSHTAGAFFDGATITDTAAAETALAANDSAPFLASRQALFLTGPTGTNVNDLRILLTPP